jgi:hypothetical protein
MSPNCLNNNNNCLFIFDYIFPNTWLRYVDDIFAIIKVDKIDETLTCLNSQHTIIQFTVEVALFLVVHQLPGS